MYEQISDHTPIEQDPTFQELVELVVLLLADVKESHRYMEEIGFSNSFEKPEHQIWIQRTKKLMAHYNLDVLELQACVKRAIVLFQTNSRLDQKARPYLDLFFLGIYRDQINWNDLFDITIERHQPVHDELPDASGDGEDF